MQAVLGPMACQAPTGIGEDPWPKTLPQTRICSPLQPGSPPTPPEQVTDCSLKYKGGKSH